MTPSIWTIRRADFSAAVLALMCAAIFLPTGAWADKAVEPVELSDIRGMRYCEFLLIYDDRVEIYNTSASDGCPADKWDALDVDALAAENGAVKAQLNGPKFWAVDAQNISLGETKSFGGIDARYGATLPLSAVGSGEGADPYTPFTSAKDQTFFVEAGQPVYQLTDAEGQTYLLNAYGGQVTDGDPSNLVDQLQPPEGWRFDIVTLDAPLTVEGSSDTPVHMVGDDLRQYYTRYEAGGQ
ncbi:hypothetical protein [Oceanomicrobium pacificus]|uniref:Secreted protein n=1 Tax=Oceanomicrobium pacificus TaxID=2692916 RepID=A0A6B0TTW9_9RHOB|nr:hypothetical protein [Oceanomicrobium pacificus]MXU66229.1 hypothetical protein [Oceanomicrobium pacificus]